MKKREKETIDQIIIICLIFPVIAEKTIYSYNHSKTSIFLSDIHLNMLAILHSNFGSVEHNLPFIQTLIELKCKELNCKEKKKMERIASRDSRQAGRFSLGGKQE